MRARHRTAILIACKNGQATIANTVRSAIGQADVYVVSDGSDDCTAEEAVVAGARVLRRDVSGGKPDALRAGIHEFALAGRYPYIAVLDDDTVLEPEYLAKVVARMDGDANIAAASGRIDALWDHKRRWNPYIAMRAFTYWSYQVTMKRAQNALKVVNVICGANSVFRSEIFAGLVEEDAPYAIDDMYWVAEIVRKDLGRVAYVHDARSWTIDPHTFRDWYKQTVRWSWGQFQSIRGHRLGQPIARDRSRRLGVRVRFFDVAYLALLLDWIPYMIEPLLIIPAVILVGAWFNPLWLLAIYLATSLAWIGLAAIALKKPRLILLAPAILVLDIVYRATMMHAFVKTVFRPRIETCKWDSPKRFDVEAGAPETTKPQPTVAS